MEQAAGMKCLVHDFRRTALRGLIRVGVSQKVCKEISGHLTDAVFDSYNITSMADVKAAAALLDARNSSSLAAGANAQK